MHIEELRVVHVQLNGFRQRSLGKRAKSLSEEHSSAPCAIASAARCASDVRFPPVPRGNRRSLMTLKCCAAGSMVTTDGCDSHAATISKAVSTDNGLSKIPDRVVTRRKARRTAQDKPTVSEPESVDSSHPFAL